jgi:hypothetical protein
VGELTGGFCFAIVLALVGLELCRFFAWLAGNTDGDPPRPAPDTPREELQELNVAAEQVQALVDRGLLTAEQALPVLDSIDTRKAQLLQPAEPRLPLYTAVPQPDEVPVLEHVTESLPAPVPVSEVQPSAIVRPPVPRRRLGDILNSFMEEKNILWGELVGGLLIVGCSIALVISLWQTLERIPYFPFIIVSSISLAVFGAGQYTLHHWKLESTSRGLLVIAGLLVPLNLVVLAGLARGHEGGIVEMAVSLAALALFTWMVRSVGKGQVGAEWTLPLAVVGTTAIPLVLPWLPADAVFWIPVIPGCVAVACFVAGVAMRFRRLPVPGELEHERAVPFYLFLGLSGFAVAVSLAFFASQGVRMALPLSLAAAPVVAVGLLLHRRLPTAAGLARTAVTGIALFGMLVMLVTPLLAWTHPLSLLLVCLLNGAVLIVIAFRLSAPFAQAGALPFLGLAALVGFHLLAGRLAPAAMPADEVLSAMLASDSSIVLTTLAILLLAVAEILARHGREEHAIYHAVGGACIGGFALLLAGVYGLDEPGRAALVFLVQGSALLATNIRWRWPAVSDACYGLLLCGTLWVLAWWSPSDLAVWCLVLACESLLFALLSAWRGHNGQLGGLGKPVERETSHWSDSLTGPCEWFTLVVACISLLTALILDPEREGWPFTSTAFLLSGTILLWAWVSGRQIGTWAGAFLLCAGFTHLLVVEIPAGWLALPWLTALLLTATLLLLASLLLRFVTVEPIDEIQTAGHWFGWRVRHVFTHPAGLAANVFTALALPGLPLAKSHLTALGLHLAWLAGLWLVLAWSERSAAWLTAAQAILTGAVAVLTTDWIREHGWAISDVRAFQAFGVTFGLLGIGWVAVRRVLRASEVARALFTPPWPPFDRVVLAILPLGALLLAIIGVLPGLEREWFTGERGTRIDEHLYGPGAWWLLGILALLFTAALWDRDRDFAAPGLMLLGLTLPFLAAARMDQSLASASALRWGLGIAFLVLSLPLWGRGRLANPQVARAILLAVTVGGVLLLTGEVARIGFSGEVPTGPGEDTVFASMGWTASNIVPLLLVCVGLAGHGIRERDSWYHLVGGAVAWLSVTGGYALSVVTGGDELTTAHLVRLWQLGCLASAVWAALWLIHALFDAAVEGMLLGIQSLLGLACFALLAVEPILEILIVPGGAPSPALSAFAGPIGWIAWAAALTVTILYLRRGPVWLAEAAGAGGLLLGVLVATLVGGAAETRWPACHVLILSWSLLAIVAGVTFVRQPQEVRDAFRVEGMAWLLTVCALCAWESPIRPWPTSGPLLLASILMGALAICRCRPSRVYASGGLLVLASLLAWHALGDHALPGFLLTTAASLAAASLIWTALILRLRTRRIELAGVHVDFAHVAALGALLFVGLAVVSEPINPLLAWPVWMIVVLALLALLWDEQANFAPGGLYEAAVIGILLGLRTANLGWTPSTAVAALLLAVLLLSTTVICGFMSRRGEEWERLGLASWVVRGPVRDWFITAQIVVAVVVIVLGFGLAVGEKLWVHRLAGASATALCMLAAIEFVSVLSGRQQQLARRISLLFAPLVLAELGWVLLEPVEVIGVLHHTAASLSALVLSCAIYRREWQRIPEAWREEVRWVGTIFGFASAAALALLTAAELRLYDPILRRTSLSGIEVALAGLASAGLIALALQSALTARTPDDQLGLRRLIVYSSELLLVLLFIHLRLNIPLLRQATAVQYWPVMVLVLAFVGVGLAELFRRRGLGVLATPLHRTGLFLPLLPLIAFWLRPTPELLDAAGGFAPGLKVLLSPLLYMPETYSGYALIWFLVSLLLLGIALAQRSFAYALAAALASNVGLWMMLTHHGLSFLLHPQLWLVPLGLIILIAEQLNRDELTREQRLALRYAGLLLLYISSTADMFITGIGNSAVLPLVLAVLAVLGMLAGIVLQVRAFLFVGVLFLLVDVLSMIWHAAVGRAQTWVWYVSGIVLGSVILALFAVFEKRRDDVRHLVEQIKRWD